MCELALRVSITLKLDRSVQFPAVIPAVSSWFRMICFHNTVLPRLCHAITKTSLAVKAYMYPISLLRKVHQTARAKVK